MKRTKTLTFFFLALASAWSIFFLGDGAVEEEEDTYQLLHLSADAMRGVTRLVVVRGKPEVIWEPRDTEEEQGPKSVPRGYYHEFNGFNLVYSDKLGDGAVAAIALDSPEKAQIQSEHPKQAPHFTIVVDGNTLYVYEPQVVKENDHHHLADIDLPRTVTRVETDIPFLNVSTGRVRGDLEKLEVRARGFSLDGRIKYLNYQYCSKTAYSENDFDAPYARMSVDTDSIERLDAVLGALIDARLDAPNLRYASVKMDADADLKLLPSKLHRVLQWQPLSEAEKNVSVACVDAL